MELLENFLTDEDLDAVRTALNNKADKEHSHKVENIEGLQETLAQYPLQSEFKEVQDKLETKSEIGHEHGLNKINDWRSHLYDKTEVNDLLNALTLGFTWKAPVESVEALESLGTPELGWATIVDGDKLYVYGEDGWIDLGMASLPPVATEEHDGLMSHLDKAKLNSIDSDKLAQLDVEAMTQAIQSNTTATSQVNGKLGDLSALTTTAKSSLVLAINELVSNKAGVQHTHAITSIEGLQAHLEARYTKEEVNNLLKNLDLTTVTDKIAVNTQAIQDLSADLTSLDDYVKALDLVVINDNGTSASMTWSSAYIQEQIDEAVSQKANSNHTHRIEDVYGLQAHLTARYTKEEVDGLFDSFVPELNIPTATTTTDGLMSKEDKTKLNQLDLTTIADIQSMTNRHNQLISENIKNIEAVNVGLNTTNQKVSSLETQIEEVNETISQIDVNAPRIYAQAEAPSNPVAGTIWIKIEN